MKYGLGWDKYKLQLTLSRGWAALFLIETLVIAGLFLTALFG